MEYEYFDLNRGGDQIGVVGNHWVHKGCAKPRDTWSGKFDFGPGNMNSCLYCDQRARPEAPFGQAVYFKVERREANTVLINHFI